MTVLVTGGAGYVGSHIVLELLERGERVVVIDDLSTGARVLVPDEAHFIEGNAGDTGLVRSLLVEHGVDSVVHCAGSIDVSESANAPLAYYENNTVVTHGLTSACVAAGVRNFIFSSTAAVYGENSLRPIDEGVVPNPISPYGRSKLMAEWILEDVSRANDFRFVTYRYFNVAGADPQGRAGPPKTSAHLIGRACQVALGQAEKLFIFGTDYPTPDGTGVRDYVHVSDVAAAHLDAIKYLRSGGASTTLNCGYGSGFSVRDVIGAVERVSLTKLNVGEGSRRAEDPAFVVADVGRISRSLGWSPKHCELDAMVGSAYRWAACQSR